MRDEEAKPGDAVTKTGSIHNPRPTPFLAVTELLALAAVRCRTRRRARWPFSSTHQSRQSVVDGLVRGKCAGDIRSQQDKIGPGPVAFHVLAADAPGLEIREFVFSSQVVRRVFSLPHRSFVRCALRDVN